MPLVLVIDDEPVLLRLLEVNLRAAGFDVRTASSGAAALASADERRPDVVVLDLGLPDVDGWDVLASLRARPTVRDVPVVVLSGRGAGARRGPDGAPDEGYPADVDAFLVKPVEPTDLVDAVRDAVAGAGA
jgi:two-component system KDP operon response regulator KdpE